MVLAAGLGTRMRPLAATTPKPLIRVAGRALIDHVLDRIRDAEIPRAVVNVHHLADQIEAHLSTRTAPSIIISDERKILLDTGGGIVFALPHLGSGPWLIHNSDSIWIETGRPCLSILCDAWDAGRMDCLLLLAPVGSRLGYGGRGDFTLAPDNRICRPAAREHVPFVFAGASILAPSLLQGMPEGPFSLNVPWNSALAAGRAYGVVLEGRWMHVGDPQALAAAEEMIARHDGAAR
jgi:MurNAc alpha-1-phosphate uridylyltransferase